MFLKKKKGTWLICITQIVIWLKYVTSLGFIQKEVYYVPDFREDQETDSPNNELMCTSNQNDYPRIEEQEIFCFTKKCWYKEKVRDFIFSLHNLQKALAYHQTVDLVTKTVLIWQLPVTIVMARLTGQDYLVLRWYPHRFGFCFWS